MSLSGLDVYGLGAAFGFGMKPGRQVHPCDKSVHVPDMAGHARLLLAMLSEERERQMERQEEKIAFGFGSEADSVTSCSSDSEDSDRNEDIDIEPVEPESPPIIDTSFGAHESMRGRVDDTDGLEGCSRTEALVFGPRSAQQEWDDEKLRPLPASLESEQARRCTLRPHRTELEERIVANGHRPGS